MKRFYCVVCKKVKRVQKLPLSIEVGWTTDVVANRRGKCNWHDDPEYFTRMRSRAPRFVKSVPPVTGKSTSANSGGKRGR